LAGAGAGAGAVPGVALGATLAPAAEGAAPGTPTAFGPPGGAAAAGAALTMASRVAVNSARRRSSRSRSRTCWACAGGIGAAAGGAVWLAGAGPAGAVAAGGCVGGGCAGPTCGGATGIGRPWAAAVATRPWPGSRRVAHRRASKARTQCRMAREQHPGPAGVNPAGKGNLQVGRFLVPLALRDGRGDGGRAATA